MGSVVKSFVCQTMAAEMAPDPMIWFKDNDSFSSFQRHNL